MKFARIVVFTFLTAMAVTLLSNKAGAMVLFEEGSGQKTLIGSHKIDQSSVPKPKPKPTPVVKREKPIKKSTVKATKKVTAVKKTTAVKKKTPKAAKKESDEVRMRRIVNEELNKREAKNKIEEKKWKLGKAVQTTIVGGAGGAAVGAIPTFGGGAGPGALIGAASGLTLYNLDWAYDNYGEAFVNGYKKASKLEDPMGRWNP